MHTAPPVLECLAFEGLCNRINALAAALATERPVLLRWAVCRHCPARFEDLFAPMVGVSVVNETVDAYDYAFNRDQYCWFYPKNLARLPVDVFRERVFAAYRNIIGHFIVSGAVTPPGGALGVHFRDFTPDGGPVDQFCDGIERILEARRPQGLFITSDGRDRKKTLIEHFSSRGHDVHFNDVPLMNHDLERSLESVLGMARDLMSLCGCALGVVSNSARSTVADAVRGFGKRVYYTYDDGSHRHQGRDDLYVFRGVDDCINAG